MNTSKQIVLTVDSYQRVMIGNNVSIQICVSSRNKVKIAIEAPRGMNIVRSELLKKGS